MRNRIKIPICAEAFSFRADDGHSAMEAYNDGEEWNGILLKNKFSKGWLA